MTDKEKEIEKENKKKHNKEWRKTFFKELRFSLLIAVGFVSAVFLIIILLGLSGEVGGTIISWSVFIGIFITFLILLAWHRTDNSKVRKKKPSMFKFFQYGIRVVIILLLVIGLWGILEIFSQTGCSDCAVFQAVGLGIVILWSVVFFSYFIWAVYFYNINYGYTEEDWEKIFEAKENKKNGDLYSAEILSGEPKENPYRGETFGLPGGTVRGMIALTLLFGALAMLVVSFGMKNELDANSMFWDQYEFFKTAFLMMIAFYFGSKSLEYLRPDGAPKPGRPEGNIGTGSSAVPGSSASQAADEEAVYQENPMIDTNAATENEETTAGKNTPIQPEGDQDKKIRSRDDRVSGKDVDPMSK